MDSWYIIRTLIYYRTELVIFVWFPLGGSQWDGIG